MNDINEDGIESGCIMMFINGAALVLNIMVLINLVVNRRVIPPYMWLVFNLTAAHILFAFLGIVASLVKIIFLKAGKHL